MFSEVGEMELFPASSQVLLKRDGYRECLQIYRLLHIARAPIFDHIQDAIDNRRIDQLYEFWCFFKLAEELTTALDGKEAQPQFQGALADEAGGLRYGLKANLLCGYELVYNRTFCRDESYSVPLRPDFSLLHSGVLQVVFDAKFRFDEQDISKLDKPIEQEMDEAMHDGDLEHLAKRADICKMHTYRDALKCRAAVILYPGMKEVFFKTDGTKPKGISIKDIVAKSDLEGVGAVLMVQREEGEGS